MNRPFWRIPAWLAMGALLACCGTAAGIPSIKMGGTGVPLTLDTTTRIDVNNIDAYVTNSGGFARDLQDPGGPAGFYFPKGTTKTAVYAAGLWLGGVVGTDTLVTVAEYSFEYQPGQIHNAGGTITYDDPTLPVFHTYKLVRGDTTADDYVNWPVASGAPVDANGKPQMTGDETLWGVFNDANPQVHTNEAGSTAPMNVEVHQTTFGFDRPAPLGNMIFVKWKIYNKGNSAINNAYVSFWSDPDLGGANDDLVGCDTTLSTGFVYNSNNNDEIYGGSPPCVGYRFFQGPIIPGAATDTAHVSGVPVPGYKNLPMTSFNKYINGTDPNSHVKTYHYMEGLLADGTPYIYNGLPTKFFHSGDPVAQTGDLDPTAADKRLMLSSGPFNMAPGDSQEVVVGMIVGQGSDRLASITLMKTYAVQSKEVFDVQFNIPSPPPTPTLYLRPEDGAVDVAWGTQADGNVQESIPLNQRYVMEGFNLYQGESIAGPWHPIDSWDVADSVSLIYGDVNDPRGGPQKLITEPAIAKPGTNLGLSHHILLTQDAIRGGPLHNYSDYFYAITAYSYDVKHCVPYFSGPNQVGFESPTLVGSQQGQAVQPKASAAVLEVPGGATRTAGTSDGSVQVEFVRPELVPRGTFDVTFRKALVGTDSMIVWDLTQHGTTDTLLKAQTHQGSDPNDYAYPVVQGMMPRVLGPAPGFKHDSRPGLMIDEVIAGDGQGGGSAVPPDGNGGPGKACFWARNSTGEWSLSCGGGDGGEDRLTRVGGDTKNLTSADIIMKWDYADDNWGWWSFSSGVWAKIPFGLYVRDPVTHVETRLVPEFTANGGTEGVYDIQTETDGHYGLPCTDWCYGYTFDGNWAALVADVEADGVLNNDTTDKELFARLVVVQRGANPVLPAKGTVIEFSTTKPNTPLDSFQFTAHAAGDVAGTVVGDDMRKILVVPNPYLNQSKYELDQFNRILKFINLPAKPATIRIFDLSGQLVRTLEKTDKVSSEFTWDLLNEHQIPVASGIYIYNVEVKGVGTHTGKMAVFIEKERLNRF